MTSTALASPVTHSFPPEDLMDWHLTRIMRHHNETHNQKPAVISTLQKFLCSLCSRLGLHLSYRGEVKEEEQELHHTYRVSDRLLIEFRSYGPLSKRTYRPIQQPQTLERFQRFLDDLNGKIEAPHNAAITDLLRCLTVVNEKDFLIDLYTDTEESFLEIRSPQLRQSIEFTITHG